MYFKICCLLCLPLTGMGQSVHQSHMEGDAAYEKEQFEAAAQHYNTAYIKGEAAKSAYNLGNSLYQWEKITESIPYFEASAKSFESVTQQAQAFHNLGNAYYQTGNWLASIEAYKNALRRMPASKDTQRNLAKAILQLQQAPPPPPDKKKPPPPPSKNGPAPPPPPNEQDKNKETPPPPLTEQEAQQLLQLINREEQEVQKKLRKGAADEPNRPLKDW